MNKLKKILSVLLATIMLFSSFSLTMAYAADDITEDEYDHLPQIYVGGLGCAPIYYKDDPEKETLFYPIDFSRVLLNLLNSGDYILGAIKSKNPDLLYEYLYAWLMDSFGMLSLEGDGVTMKDEVTCDPIELKYDGDGVYLFDYDSRRDPVDMAHELDKYIDWVQEDSGSQKVELVGSSYGTTVVMAYLNEYRNNWDSVDSVVLCVPSVGGINFFGEVFSGEIDIDATALRNFLKEKIGLNVTPIVLKAMSKGGVLDKILDCFAEPLLREAVLDAALQFIRDCLATLPAAWTCIKDEHFESSMINIFGNNYMSVDHKFRGLIDKVTYYHNTVMINAETIIKEAQSAGLKMNIICKYGNAPVPVSKDGNFAGDGIVELKVSSFGATSGMHLQKLPADYKQALFPEYNLISTDECVDASTGLLPFNTWYIKGLAHGGKNEDYFRLINTVAYDDPDVFSSDEFPQFLEVSEEDTEKLIPMKTMEDKTNYSVLQDILDLFVSFFKNIINKIKSVFVK